MISSDESPFHFRSLAQEGAAELTFHGRLDAATVGPLWTPVLETVEASAPSRLVLDAGEVDYCDASGVGLILTLRRRQQQRGGTLEILNLREGPSKLLALMEGEVLTEKPSPAPSPLSLFEEVGKASYKVWQDIRAQLVFIGELTAALTHSLRRPGKVRWRDTMRIAELGGVNALPIVALISFLIGLIMAFQAAIPMKKFAAEIFVADLIALSMLRELGPLMTALLLTGRSSSALAAELGTMKVNEEINALTTMGLNPVPFLVVPRVLASLAMTPLLTIFANLCGLVGGAVVLLSMGYPLITYVNQVLSATDLGDLFSGLLKSLVFALIVAGVGCLRGLQTKMGASAVGESATRAVVSGIILIVITDGLFAVLYYILGI